MKDYQHAISCITQVIEEHSAPNDHVREMWAELVAGMKGEALGVEHASGEYKYMKKLRFNFLGNMPDDLHVRVQVVGNAPFAIRDTTTDAQIRYEKNDPALIGAEYILDKAVVFG